MIKPLLILVLLYWALLFFTGQVRENEPTIDSEYSLYDIYNASCTGYGTMFRIKQHQHVIKFFVILGWIVSNFMTTQMILDLYLDTPKTKKISKKTIKCVFGLLLANTILLLMFCTTIWFDLIYEHECGYYLVFWYKSISTLLVFAIISVTLLLIKKPKKNKSPNKLPL